MYASTEQHGHFMAAIYEPLNLAVVLNTQPDVKDFDHLADSLRSQGFLPTAQSYTFHGEDGAEVYVNLWERQGVGMLDELTRELSETVARRAEALVYKPSVA